MLKQIQVGEHTVSVEITRLANDALRAVATIGQIKREKTLHSQGPHDHPIAQAQKEVDDFAQRIAEEAAGAEQSRLNLDAIFGANQK